MKVLEIVHGFPPAAQGGAEIYAASHARALGRLHGDDVLVLTRDNDRTRPEYAVLDTWDEGVRVVRINNTFRDTSSFEETYRNPSIARLARQVIDEFAPDVAHIHHLTCLSTDIVALLNARRVPVFFTLHDFWLICHRGQLLDVEGRVCSGPGEQGCHRCLGGVAGVPPMAFQLAPSWRAIERHAPPPLMDALRSGARHVAGALSSAKTEAEEERRRTAHMREVCAVVTKFLAPSRFIRDQFIAFGVDPERITLSPYGVEAPAATTSNGDGRVLNHPLRVGFLGSLMLSKAPHVLLEACASLPREAVSVSLYGSVIPYHGDDTYRDRLAPLLAQANVRCLGPVSHDRVPHILRDLDLLVVPSVWPENSPLVIAEAFAAGVPVVASRIGGIPEIVQDGINGLLFEPGNVAALRDALTRVLNEPELLVELRDNIRAGRSLEDDVAGVRQMYADHRRSAQSTGNGGIAAVVVNYGTPDDTLLAVRSLLASRTPLTQIMVVDNSTDDRCPRALTDVRGEVAYLPSGRNLGFAGGVNAGIDAALARGAEAVLLVNSDAVVPPDCLESLVAELRGAVGIVGPVLRGRSDPDRIASLGLAFNPVSGRLRQLGEGTLAPLTPMRTEALTAVSGCVMLIRRSVFDAIGFFDERFFFGFEDLDFCLRAAAKGFGIVRSGAATAYHEGSRSIGATSSRRLYFATRNHLLAASRLTPPLPAVQTAARSAAIVVWNLLHAARAPGGAFPSRIAAVLKGARDYARGRFGPLDPVAHQQAPPPRTAS